MRRAVVALFAAIVVLALAVAGGMVVASDRPNGAAGTFVVVFPPSTAMSERFRRIHAAGGAVVRQGTLPGTAVAQSDRPGFAGRLRAQGAVLVLTESVFSFTATGGCFPVEIYDPRNNPKVPVIR